MPATNEQATIGILDEFQTELVDCWRRLPNKGLFFALFGAWLALFQFLGNPTLGYINSPSLFRWTLNAYNPNGDYLESDDGHGILVPFVVLALFWWKRKQLLSLPLRGWWPGMLMLGAAALLHIFGFLIQQPRISLIAFFMGIYGLMGMAWGREWLRASFFPFFLFIFCLPVSGYLQPITFQLRLLASRIVELVCHGVFGISVLRQGTALADPTGHYQYDIAAACSGIRSLIATTGLAMIFALVSIRTWWKRAALIASAIPLAIICNVVRLLTIVIAAEFGGQAAGSYVHDGGPLGILSLLPYVPAFIGLFWLENRLRKGEPEETQSPEAKAA